MGLPPAGARKRTPHASKRGPHLPSFQHIRERERPQKATYSLRIETVVQLKDAECPERSHGQMKTWLVLLLLCPLFAAAKTNILLIVSDDQGWNDIGSMGIKPIKTPVLDKLCAEGVRATNFYVTWPACTPSRGSILTGRYPQRNGLYDMIRNDVTDYGHLFSLEEYAVSPEMTIGLDEREKTLGDLLSGVGYLCGVVGKWDMGQARRYLPLQRGFHFFYGHGNNGIDYYTHERYGVASMFSGNERTQQDKGTYATDLFEREALKFLASTKEQPWFLYLCFNAPHSASSFGPNPAEKKSRPGVQCPDEYANLYQNDVKEERLRRYFGSVTRMDEAIGRVLAAIEAKGQTQDTLVLFLSDNGGSGNGGNSPLRGAKGTMWEGGLRVPLIVRWPAKVPAGRTTDAFLTSLEFWPTIAAATGASPPNADSRDGFDMLPVLRGEAESPRKAMFWQRRNDKAARVGSWKWVESEKGGGLFDLSKDIAEARDLSTARPEKLAELKNAWMKWRSEMDASAPRGPFRDY